MAITSLFSLSEGPRGIVHTSLVARRILSASLESGLWIAKKGVEKCCAKSERKFE